MIGKFYLTQKEYDEQLRYLEEAGMTITKEIFLKTYDVYYSSERLDLLLNLQERLTNASWTANK